MIYNLNRFYNADVGGKVMKEKIMLDYANREIKFNGCPGCAFGNHQFDLLCGMAYENERFTLSQDWALPILGFLVLSPKKHIEKLEELTKEERDEMFYIVDKTIKILRTNNICDKFNVVFEEKENSHFHVWIMPRHEWMKNVSDDIIDNVGKVFEYAKANFRIAEVYEKIKDITLLVNKEFRKEKYMEE